MGAGTGKVCAPVFHHPEQYAVRCGKPADGAGHQCRRDPGMDLDAEVYRHGGGNGDHADGALFPGTQLREGRTEGAAVRHGSVHAPDYPAAGPGFLLRV